MIDWSLERALEDAHRTDDVTVVNKLIKVVTQAKTGLRHLSTSVGRSNSYLVAPATRMSPGRGRSAGVTRASSGDGLYRFASTSIQCQASTWIHLLSVEDSKCSRRRSMSCSAAPVQEWSEWLRVALVRASNYPRASLTPQPLDTPLPWLPHSQMMQRRSATCQPE